MLFRSDCGLVHKVHRISVPRFPLKAYEDLRAFKLYLLDVGLLTCMVQLDPGVVLDGNKLFQEFKGALTEQYVLQQFKTLQNASVYYWTNDQGTAEVDFVVDINNMIAPVEVKAETNLQAKSLKVYYEKFNPPVVIRTSMANYKNEQWLLNLPLYSVNFIDLYLDQQH